MPELHWDAQTPLQSNQPQQLTLPMGNHVSGSCGRRPLFTDPQQLRASVHAPHAPQTLNAKASIPPTSPPQEQSRSDDGTEAPLDQRANVNSDESSNDLTEEYDDLPNKAPSGNSLSGNNSPVNKHMQARDIICVSPGDGVCVPHSILRVTDAQSPQAHINRSVRVGGYLELG